ncbi:MAG TPA: Rv3235 family protein [Streptosporangiaceae bacterium]|jgi:hypothetical protein
MQIPPLAPSGRPDTTGEPSLAPGFPSRQGGARRPEVTRPLPDPVAFGLCAIPDTGPPYDEAAPAESGPARADIFAARIAAALDSAATLRCAAGESEDSPPEEDRPHGRLQEPVTPVVPVRPGDSGTGGQADPWPSRFAQVLAETLAGSRPPAQLAPWTTERARSHIRRLGPMLAAGQRPFVHRVVTSLPSADVMEMSIVVGFGPRVRALAIRLERAAPRPASPGVPGRQAHWQCTTVEAA